MYIDCISAIMVSSLHGGVNTGSRSNSELSLRTPQRRWRPRPPRFPTEKTRFPFAAPSVDTQVRCFRMAALKFLLFSGKHGMGFFRQGRGRCVSTLDHQGLPFAETKSVCGFRKFVGCWAKTVFRVLCSLAEERKTHFIFFFAYSKAG